MIVEGNQTWVELREAANMLHLCERQLHRYRRRYELQEKRVGWYVYVDLDDMLWLKDCIDPCGRPRHLTGEEVIDATLIQFMLTILTFLIDACSRGLTWAEFGLKADERIDVRELRQRYVALRSTLEDARTYRDVMLCHLALFDMPEQDDDPLEAMDPEQRFAQSLVNVWFDAACDTGTPSVDD